MVKIFNILLIFYILYLRLYIGTISFAKNFIVAINIFYYNTNLIWPRVCTWHVFFLFLIWSELETMFDHLSKTILYFTPTVLHNETSGSRYKCNCLLSGQTDKVNPKAVKFNNRSLGAIAVLYRLNKPGTCGTSI